MANSESNSLQLFVKLPEGETIEIQSYSSHLVVSIQEKILMKSMIPVTEQKLYYQGIQLEREKKLEAYSIKDKACLELIIGCDDTSEPLQEIHQLSSNICRMCRDKSVSEDPNSDDALTIAALLAPERRVKSEIFMIWYSVPETLLMLHRSEIEDKKAHAKALILLCMVLILNRPQDVIDGCIHLALQFCNLLRDEVSDNDPLFKSCRNTLKQLLEKKDYKIGSLGKLSALNDISRIFLEMARTLYNGLDQIQASNSMLHVESLKVNFREFQAFSRVLRCAVCSEDCAHEDDKSLVDSLSEDIKHVFNFLLPVMEEHLLQLPRMAQVFETSGCLRPILFMYLDILEELNSISQLSVVSEGEQFRSVLKSQQISLRLILEKVTREDDYLWLLKHIDVIDAESRMHLVTMMMIPEEKLLDSEFYKPLIHWSRFLDEELFEALKNKKLTSPQQLQDWLYKLCQAIFKPQNLLFLACPNDPTKFYPNPELKLEPLHFDCFEFSGKVIALALMHEVQAKHRFHDDDEIRDDFLNSVSEQISFFRKGFDNVFGKSIVELLSYEGIEFEDLNLALKGKLNLGERTHVNQGNNVSDPLMSQFLKINRQRVNINKLRWRMDRRKTLGGGITGNVYRGYADDGFFFAVKEVQVENKEEIDESKQETDRIHQDVKEIEHDNKEEVDKIKLEHDHVQQEVNLLCQLSHPNIVKYYGTKEYKSKIHIFLQLVSTGSLRQVYKKFELRDSQVSHYTKQILEGLKYLHERKVPHKDIKCANILVDEKGCVKITDFGLARVTDLIPFLNSRHGKIHWIAPEVIKKNKEYGVESDIWSLGCTVLEMLIRDFPYSHVNENENLQSEVENGMLLDHLPNYPLSENARDFIMKCLQVDPKKRPTASQLLNHLFVKDSGF
ncbi:E3 ubiquitin-protein ligase UPL5 isoform X2 [Manihot esculenta]|uniref:E3 ubiquitin-protein ligase UPL5 isoform X2 n=1 Tax=Manihot esculenta TaxID=3983 RepID=UPI000B5D1E37|nr:E3 ubiquitin-protein ligase UPL5 isoform X2 [Manihot esculenta]